MKDPSIAVLIPSYNHARYLPSLFQSIIDQTYQNLELVISDDGSTDNTRQIIDTWYPRLATRFKVKLIYFQQNNGDQAWTNIKCLAEEMPATDYVQLCESDDYFKVDKFEKQINYLREHPEMSAVHSDVEAVYEDGTNCPAFWKTYRHTQTGGDSTIPTGDIRKQLEHCNFIYTCSLMVERNLYKKHFTHDRFQKELETGFGDYPFFLSLSREAKIGYVDEPLSVYRVLGDSLSHKDRPWVIEKTEHIKNLARQGII